MGERVINRKPVNSKKIKWTDERNEKLINLYSDEEEEEVYRQKISYY